MSLLQFGTCPAYPPSGLFRIAQAVALSQEVEEFIEELGTFIFHAESLTTQISDGPGLDTGCESVSSG